VSRKTPPPFDLDALEFAVVRTMLTERLLTPLGRTAVEALGPLPDLVTAQQRHAAVAALAQRLKKDKCLPIGSAVEVRSWLGGFCRGEHQLQAKDLAELKRCLRAAERCRVWLLAAEQVLVVVAAKVPDLEALVAELEQAVDDRGEVLSTASQKLLELRAEIETARGAVDAAVMRVLGENELRKYLQSPEPAWRHGRPVLQVKHEFRSKVSGVLHDRSASGATLFIEPDRVVEAANRLSDAMAAEHREINVVLAGLARGLRRRASEITDAIEFLALADLLQACAKLCVLDGYTVPQIGALLPLRMRGARHPLMLRQPQVAVITPLEVSLGDPNRMLVVTGPNTGGKTVVLKTIGLLALMSQSGVPVPAEEGAQFPWFSAVQADIGDEQGISQNLSTFSSHVQRLARCLAFARDDALVLLDELGAGTDPEEGGVLGYAVLEQLLAARALAVVSTHLDRLKDFAYQHEGAENGSMAFDGASLAPLYRLDVGIPGQSHALAIALRVGMPEPVVRRARELLGKRDTSLQDVIERVQVARAGAEADRRRSAESSRQVEQHKSRLEEQLLEAQRKEGWVQEEADAVLEGDLRTAQALLLEGLQPLLSAPGQHGERARLLKVIVDGLQKRTAMHRRRMRFCHDLKKGATVFLPRWRRLCLVHKVDRVKETVVVDYGNVKMEVPFEDVSWLQPIDGA
jgi:DNA mismatch repair protein MutS2